jgi:hypothetical protein
MQRERRRDPYPWTWEIPLLLILIALFVLIIGIQLGRSVANLLAGTGWTWPDPNAGAFPSPIGTAFWTSLPGVLGGHADAGLAAPVPSDLASAPMVWTSVLLTEATVLAATVWIGVYFYQRSGPGRMRGMATSAEAEKLLGVTRLRKVAGIVRPDLYGKHAKPAPAVRRGAGPEPDATNVELGRGLSPWLLRGRTIDKETR